MAPWHDIPQAAVPDNLKAAVIQADRYEPQLNDIFQDFDLHYQTTILPASRDAGRAYKPRDKTLVEGAVKLPDKIFTSLPALNQALRELLTEYNQISFKGKSVLTECV